MFLRVLLGFVYRLGSGDGGGSLKIEEYSPFLANVSVMRLASSVGVWRCVSNGSVFGGFGRM